jgi:phage repressor protein C with HTH and peptisase S24 domain
MLSHADVWRGVDRLAEVNGLTPSGLARRSGLDPTTFNKSKRATRDGRPRWPSTESLAKILEATHTSFAEFVALIDPSAATLPRPTVPYVPLSRMAASQFDGAGFPAAAFERIELSNLAGPHLYAIELDSDAFAPVYRQGDTLLVAPDAGVRRGDRIVAMATREGPRLGTLVRKTAEHVTLGGIAQPEVSEELRIADIAWLARIVWAAQ